MQILRNSNISNPLIRASGYEYQEVRNASFRKILRTLNGPLEFHCILKFESCKKILTHSAQKMTFFIKDIFSKCDQIYRNLYGKLVPYGIILWRFATLTIPPSILSLSTFNASKLLWMIVSGNQKRDMVSTKNEAFH